MRYLIKSIVFTIITILIFVSKINAQNYVWQQKKVNEILTISFPGSVIEQDTAIQRKDFLEKMKYFTYSNDSFTLRVLISNEMQINADNIDTLKKGLKMVGEGLTESLKENGWTFSLNDTIIDGLPSVKMAASMKDERLIIIALLLNNKCYLISDRYIINNTQGVEFTTFLNSAHFNKALLNKEQFIRKDNSIAYRLGGLTFYILLVSLVVFIVLFVIRKSRSI